jgi:hypothetical protein
MKKYLLLIIIITVHSAYLGCMEEDWILIPRENAKLATQNLNYMEQHAAQELADLHVRVKNARGTLDEETYTYLHKRIKSCKGFLKKHSLNHDVWPKRLNSVKQSVKDRIGDF